MEWHRGIWKGNDIGAHDFVWVHVIITGDHCLLWQRFQVNMNTANESSLHKYQILVENIMLGMAIAIGCGSHNNRGVARVLLYRYRTSVQQDFGRISNITVTENNTSINHLVNTRTVAHAGRWPLPLSEAYFLEDPCSGDGRFIVLGIMSQLIFTIEKKRFFTTQLHDFNCYISLPTHRGLSAGLQLLHC